MSNAYVPGVSFNIPRTTSRGGGSVMGVARG